MSTRPGPASLVPAGPADAGLQRLLHTLSGLLDAGPEAGSLAHTLADRVLGEVGRVVAEIQPEIRAYDEAIARLRELADNRLLAPSPAVLQALSELERSRELAMRLVQAFTEVGPLPLAAPPADPPSISIAGWLTDVRLLDENPLPEPVPPADGPASDEEQATRLVHEAEACQRRQELDRAESLFSDAVLFDSQNASAWAGRGDTRVALGRPQEAARDYLHSLKQRPDHVRTRFHFAVALSLTGEFHRAIDEFTRVIQARGDWARAYLNRGIARQAIGDDEQAREDFATALARDPSCEKAREYLAADEVVEDVEVAEPAPPTPAKTLPETATPTTVIASPRPAKAKAVAKPGQFVINCPYCGEEGTVSWNRLNRAFQCKCGQRFGVNGEGQAVRLVVSRQGTLIEAGRHEKTVRQKRKRWLTVAASVALVLLLPAIALGTRNALRPAPVGAEAPLPAELDKRVELFTQAWLNNDTRTMKRLTTPAMDREVYSWAQRQQPPAALRSRGGVTGPEGVLIAQSTKFPKPTLAQAEVRVATHGSDARSNSATLVQTWEQRGDAWYFVPPTARR